ncbi:unnamed protein product, partial [Rotaria sp. Silwood2]
MKKNSIKQQKKKSTILSKTVYHQRYSLLNTLPILILDHIGSYLNGSDALSYADCITKFALLSERKFWQSLGPYKNGKYCFSHPLPKQNFNSISPDYFIQRLSDRQYTRFYYLAFLPSNLEKMTRHCNTQSFRTFVRLYLYSTHFYASTMSIYTFLDYSFIYQYRSLNKLEKKLFRTLRIGNLEQNPIIVTSISRIEKNLNERFCFHLTLGFYQAIATHTFISYKLTL